VEQRLEFLIGTERLIGDIHLPKDSSGPVPCVICSHGYQSNRKSEKYFQMGYRFPLEGIAVFKFDHRGAIGGESDGEFANTTLSRRVEDLLGAINALDHVRKIDPKRLGLLGSSLGGMAVLIAKSDKVKTKVIISTPFSIPRPSQEAQRSFIETGYYEYADGSKINREFYDDIKRYDMKEETKSVTCPLLIMRGDRDEIVPYDHSEMIYKYAGAQIKDLKTIEGGDHSFTNLDKMNLVIRFALDWFKRYL